MSNWKIKEIDLHLKYPWSTADYTTTIKKNFIVSIQNGETVGEGEVALNHKFGETSELIYDAFDKFKSTRAPQDITSVEELINFVDELELPSSLRFGIESAFVHYLAALSDKKVSKLLGIKDINSVKTSYSLPLLPVGGVAEFINVHNLNRFKSLKVKITPESAESVIAEVRKNFTGNLRLDANESFKDPEAVLSFLKKIGDDCPIEFFEQPLPAQCHDEYLYLYDRTTVDIMADESILSQDVTSYYSDRFHAINVKLMKAGGYLRALKQLKGAKELGLKVMLGCMVETSLGISSAMKIAHNFDYFDLDGFMYLKKDPFNLVSEENGRLFFSHLQ